MQEVEGCVAGHQEVQRPPGYWGQGLQNPAVSGAGVPRNSPGFYRREWTSQETVAFRSRKRARLRSLWEGAELCDSSLSPASSHWPPVLGSMEPGSMGGVPAQSWPQRRSQSCNHNPALRDTAGSKEEEATQLLRSPAGLTEEVTSLTR